MAKRIVLKKFKNGREITCFVYKWDNSDNTYYLKTGRPSKKGFTWVRYYNDIESAIMDAIYYTEYCKTNIGKPFIYARSF